MNVLYVYDDSFAEIAAVSIKSMVAHTHKDIHLFLVEDNVSIQNMARMREFINEIGVKVTYLVKPEISEFFNIKIKTARWGDNIFTRLFLKELLGKNSNIDKLLYVDCDTLIVDSIDELYEENIENYLAAACLDYMGDLHKQIIGVDKKAPYYNSGILLINVQKWINSNVQNQFIEYMNIHNGKIEYPDQGLINSVLGNEIKVLHAKYNMITVAYEFSYDEILIFRKPSFLYSRDVFEEGHKNPCIIHFTSSFLSYRPWFVECNHPYADEWKLVREKTPWKECSYRDTKGKRKKSIIKIFSLVPRKVAICIIGVLHAYIKPLYFQMRG